MHLLHNITENTEDTEQSFSVRSVSFVANQSRLRLKRKISCSSVPSTDTAEAT